MRTLEASYRSHVDEFGIQRLLAAPAIQWTIVLLLGGEERDGDRMQAGVLAAEQRGEPLAKVVRVLEQSAMPVVEPDRAREKLVQIGVRIEPMQFAGVILDHIAQDHAEGVAAFLADVRREEIPLVVQPEGMQVGIEHGAQPLIRSLVPGAGATTMARVCQATKSDIAV